MDRVIVGRPDEGGVPDVLRRWTPSGICRADLAHEALRSAVDAARARRLMQMAWGRTVGTLRGAGEAGPGFRTGRLG
jgi:hypothetical protein